MESSFSPAPLSAADRALLEKYSMSDLSFLDSDGGTPGGEALGGTLSSENSLLGDVSLPAGFSEESMLDSLLSPGG